MNGGMAGWLTYLREQDYELLDTDALGDKYINMADDKE